MSADTFHHARILIVDDEASEIQLLRDVLGLEGYTNVQSTADAREVLRLFTDFQPDILLLDLGMDHLDGFQIMQQLAPLIARDDYFPVVVITGDTARQTRHQALAHGAKDFLTKPFDPTEILLRVRNLLQTRFLHRQTQQQNQQLEATVRERTTELTQANEALVEKITEQERTEAALRNSEIKFRSLMESATDAIVLADHNNLITGWNRSAQTLFGYSTNEIMGQPLTVLMPERYRGEHAGGFHHLQMTPEVQIIGRTLELYGLRKDGIEFPIEVAVSTWEVEGKRCYSNIIRDITERKRVEHELRHSEMLLAEAQRLARLGSWEWNIAEDLLVWSEELYRIYGLQPQEFDPVLASFLDIVHPAERDFVQLVLDRASRDHQPFEFDHRILRPDGTVRMVHQRGMVVVDQAGQPIRMFGSTQDVTGHRQAEVALQESKEQLELVLNAVPSAISWISSNLCYLGINSYLAGLLHLEPEQVIGQEVGFLGTNPQFVELVEEFFATHARAIEREVEMTIGGEVRTFWIMARKYRHNEAAVFVGTDITERKHAEQVLQQTKDQLQLVLDTIPGGVSWMTSDLKYLAVNRFLAETFHRAQEDFVGQQVGFLHTDKGYAEFLQEFFDANEQTASHEIPVLVDEVWHTILMTVRKHNHGRSAVVIGIDITERKKAEDALQEAHDGLETRVKQRTAELNQVVAALQESQGRLLLALRAGRMGIWEWDLATNALWWSEELEKLCCLLPGSFGGTYQAFLDMVHPDDRPLVVAAVERALTGEQEYDVEARIVCPDESIRWHALTGQVIRDETGRPLRMLGTGQDITARKQKDESLRLLQSAVVEANDSIMINALDQDPPRVQYVNPAFTQMTGYSAEEVVGQNVLFLYGSETDPELRKEARRQLLQGKDFHNEIVLYRKDGTSFVAEFDLAPIPDANGEFSHLVAIIRDITARKQDEATLRAAKEEAESANRAKSDFLSRMSHELRTPLNAILGFTQLLGMDERPPREQQNLDYILKAGNHLLALIDEVLDISRIEAGRVSFSIEPVQISMAVQEAMDMVRHRATALGVQLHTEPNCDAWCLADSQRLQQVLINLLSNAIKYNRTDGEVRVSCEQITIPPQTPEAPPSNRVRILVADTGIGIPLAMQARLFTPFDRLGAEQSAVEGIGIGLVLSKRLVEVMGGQLGCESTEGQGSTFWIELPLASGPLDGELTDDDPPLLSEASELEEAEAAHTILYIEDNLSNLHLIETILNRHPGLRLIAAMQGNIGLDLARERLPDLILLDLHLPDMPGDEVLRRLRADHSTRDIPVIVLSADATPGRINQLLESGAREYLTKPLQVRQFIQTLEDVLHKT